MFVMKVACPIIELYRGTLVKSPVEPGLRTTAVVTAICMQINPGERNARRTRRNNRDGEGLTAIVGQGI